MPLNLTNHKAIDTYYAALATYQTQGIPMPLCEFEQLVVEVYVIPG